MKEMKQLRRSVDATLHRARQRVDKAQRGEGQTQHPREGLTVAAIQQVVEHQQAICADLRRELARLSSHRRKLQATIDQSMVQRHDLEQEIEMVALEIGLLRLRRHELERSRLQHEKELGKARRGREELARSVLETRHALKRISDTLKGVG